MFRLITATAGAAALTVAGLGGAGATQLAISSAEVTTQARAEAGSPAVRTVVRFRLKGKKHLRAKKRAQRKRERRMIKVHGRMSRKLATGMLAVRVNGLPRRATLTTVVRGPAGFSRVLRASRTFTGVRVGTYSLSVADFTTPTPGTARVTVSAKFAYVQSRRTATFDVRVSWRPGTRPSPTPTPRADPWPKPTAAPEPTPSPTPAATPEPTRTPTPQPPVTPAPQPTPTATPKPTATVTPKPTQPPTPEPTATPTPGPTPTSIATPPEQEVLRLTNEARSTPQDCGSYGVKPAVGPLSMESRLVTAARGHAVDMATKNYFGHNSLDGRSPGERITATGYPWRTWGENIAAGYPTPATVVAGWIDSDGHCANLMSPGFTEIGVGSATNGASTYRHYWVQNFGRR